MTTMRVGEAFDEVEDGRAGFDVGAPMGARDQFARQRGENALGQRVVETVAGC